MVPRAFSLVCFWFELSGINKTKSPLESTCEIGLGKFAFYRGRSEGKYLPPGQGFIYSAGGSQITPEGSDAFGEHRRILCARVGAWAL